jgi:hypothetical protein
VKRVFLIFATIAMITLVFSPTAFANSSIAQANQHLKNYFKPFINEVPCVNPQFLDIDGNGGDVCFANDGYIGFRINGAYSIHAGNNDGWVKCYGGPVCGAGLVYHFYAYDTYYLDGAEVTQVDITGQSVISPGARIRKKSV